MLAIPQEYIGSLCELKTLTNDFLAVGRVIKIDREALELEGRRDDRMPLLQFRLPVKLFVHHSRLDTRIMIGTIYLSTENFVRVEEVKPLSNFERRGAFRVNTELDARMSFVDAKRRSTEENVPANFGAKMDDAEFPAQVLDLSLTGVRVRCLLPLKLDSKYHLSFAAQDSRFDFYIKVQRLVKMPTGETQYGCIFYNFSERQMDLLCKVLYRLQRLEKQKRDNAPTAL